MMTHSFLCPNGTIFNQNHFICDWWFNVDCDEAARFAVERNAQLAEARRSASQGRLQTAASARVSTSGRSLANRDRRHSLERNKFPNYDLSRSTSKAEKTDKVKTAP
jgi:hypothetical protein